MTKYVVLASVAALAMLSGACSQDSASSLSGPSGVLGSAPSGSSTEARTGGGGGGGKKPGGGGTIGGTGSLTLVMAVDNNGNGAPNWGDTITWTISTTATTQPNVSVTCSQNGTVVYGTEAGYYVGYPWPWTQQMKLSSTAWSSGAASCSAKLYYFVGTSTINLGSTTFNVGA